MEFETGSRMGWELEVGGWFMKTVEWFILRLITRLQGSLILLRLSGTPLRQTFTPEVVTRGEVCDRLLHTTLLILPKVESSSIA